MGLFTPNIEKFKNNNNIQELIKCLEHKNADVRFQAFMATACIPSLDDTIIMKLKTLLNDPDERVRTVATLKFTSEKNASISDNLKTIITDGSRFEKMQLLCIIADRGAVKDETIVQVLALALHDKHEMVRLDAIKAAGATRDGHLVPHLVECLHDKLHGIRLQAAKALYEIGGEASVDYLIGLLVDKNAEVQTAVRAYLETINSEKARKALGDAKFLKLVSGMNGTEPMREETAKKIGAESLRDGLPLLHGACGDKYKGVRIEALKSISVFKDASSVDFVSQLLDDKFYDVRIEAIRTLGHISGKKAIEALAKSIDDKNKLVAKEAQSVMSRLTAS